MSLDKAAIKRSSGVRHSPESTFILLILKPYMTSVHDTTIIPKVRVLKVLQAL